MSDLKLKIGTREISHSYPPYIIAEMSGNHNGDLGRAIELVEAAAAAGADACKLQTYTADTITIPHNGEGFSIDEGLWAGQTLHDLYQSAYTPWEWHEPLFKKAQELGIAMFSSVFDETAVDFLTELDAPAYKIASFEAVDIPLINYAASTGKPLIISTGMADIEEIEEAVDAAHSGGCKELAILHCVSSYPASPKDYNLRTIKDMIDRFGLVAGISDHTLDNTTAITSIAMGASIIEKHFTLDRDGGGPDDSFSLEPADLSELCVGSMIAWEAIGKVDYEIKHSEKGNLKYRRSLYYVKDLKEIFQERDKFLFANHIV